MRASTRLRRDCLKSQTASSPKKVNLRSHLKLRSDYTVILYCITSWQGFWLLVLKARKRNTFDRISVRMIGHPGWFCYAMKSFMILAYWPSSLGVVRLLQENGVIWLTFKSTDYALFRLIYFDPSPLCPFSFCLYLLFSIKKLFIIFCVANCHMQRLLFFIGWLVRLSVI